MAETVGPPRPGTKAHLALQVEALQADLNLIATLLKAEARKRSWCSDYEFFVRHTNPKLSQPWLQARVMGTACDVCGGWH